MLVNHGEIFFVKNQQGPRKGGTTVPKWASPWDTMGGSPTNKGGGPVEFSLKLIQ